MTSGIDLDAYFRRIGYSAQRSATLETLRSIHLRHTETIPFENLSPLLGWPVRLDIDSLEQKLVHQGRGGYCFEHNLLLSHVLQALGFHVTGLAARVIWNAPEGIVPIRGHMLLRIDLDGRCYIADTGFGGLTLTGPVLLEPDIEQTTPHEPFRLSRVGDEFVLHAKIQNEWKALYRFDLQEQSLPDYEVVNWYLSNHPDSHFVTGLSAARAEPGRRFALRNNEFTVHHLNGASDKRFLQSVPELRETLAGPFRIALPKTPALDAVLERMISPLT